MGTSTVNISAAQVKELRDKTGAPMMDCKKALVGGQGRHGAGDGGAAQEAASPWPSKKAGRATSEGAVASYIHAGGKIGVLVEVNCESDFVARTEDFKELVHDIAMHIAASDPKYVRKEDVTRRPISSAKRKSIAPRLMQDRQAGARGGEIVEGKMEKFYEEVCLLEQPFIKDQTVSHRPADRGEDRQAGREHRRAPLRTLQSGRGQRDRLLPHNRRRRRRNDFRGCCGSPFLYALSDA